MTGLNPLAPSWTPARPYIKVKCPQAKSFASILKEKALSEEKTNDSSHIAIPGWQVTTQWEFQVPSKAVDILDKAEESCGEADVDGGIKIPKDLSLEHTAATLFEYRGDPKAEHRLKQQWMEIARQKREFLTRTSHPVQDRKQETRGGGWHSCLAPSASHCVSWKENTSSMTSSQSRVEVTEDGDSVSTDCPDPMEEAVTPVPPSVRDMSGHTQETFWTALCTGDFCLLEDIVRTPATALPFDWKRLRRPPRDGLHAVCPLLVAVYHRHSQCVQVLLEAGRPYCCPMLVVTCLLVFCLCWTCLGCVRRRA